MKELTDYIIKCEKHDNDPLPTYRRIVKDPSKGYWVVSALNKKIGDWSIEKCLNPWNPKKRFKLKEWEFLIKDLLLNDNKVNKNGIIFTLMD